MAYLSAPARRTVLFIGIAFVAGLFALYVGFRDLHSGKEQKRNKPKGTNRTTYPLLREHTHTHTSPAPFDDGAELRLLITAM